MLRLIFCLICLLWSYWSRQCSCTSILEEVFRPSKQVNNFLKRYSKSVQRNLQHVRRMLGVWRHSICLYTFPKLVVIWGYAGVLSIQAVYRHLLRQHTPLYTCFHAVSINTRRGSFLASVTRAKREWRTWVGSEWRSYRRSLLMRRDLLECWG